MIRTMLAAATAFASLAFLAQSAAAMDIEEKYKGRTITIVVGYGAGGTYGKTSLLLSRHLGKFIPGNPTLVVQHMPGAGGLKAANYAYNAMPKEGFHFLMPPDMSIVSQVLRPTKVKYDARNFAFLGRVFGSNNLVAVRRDSGVTGLDGARMKQVIMGSTGKGSPTFIVTSLVNGLLGAKFKIVSGYKGSARTRQAMEQGEVQGVSLAWAAWKNAHLHWFQGADSFAVGIVQSGFRRDPDLADIPLISELVEGDDAKAAAELIATSSLIGRSLALPPGVPKELVEPLRQAFWKTVNDPEFMADAKKTKLPLSQLKGGDIQITADRVLGMSPDTAAKARKAIFGS